MLDDAAPLPAVTENSFNVGRVVSVSGAQIIALIRDPAGNFPRVNELAV